MENSSFWHKYGKNPLPAMDCSRPRELVGKKKRNRRLQTRVRVGYLIVCLLYELIAAEN
jgi:hypothetical protein